MKRFLDQQWVRYVLVGISNTALTYLTYVLMLFLFSYNISYAISYVSGVFYAYFLNSKFVFKTSLSIKKFIKFPLVYVVQFLINWIFLFMFVEKLELSQIYAPIIVTIISLPISFVLSKLILLGKKNF